ncbi:unnamed protein product [Cochlearia groenlandica]
MTFSDLITRIRIEADKPITADNAVNIAEVNNRGKRKRCEKDFKESSLKPSSSTKFKKHGRLENRFNQLDMRIWKFKIEESEDVARAVMSRLQEEEDDDDSL